MSEAENIYNSPSPHSYEAETGSETQLKHVGVLSCAVVLGVLYALLGLILGGMMAMVGGVAGAAAGAEAFKAFGGSGIAMVFILPIIYGLMGFIGGSIMVLLYNLVAKINGGLKLTFY